MRHGRAGGCVVRAEEGLPGVLSDLRMRAAHGSRYSCNDPFLESKYEYDVEE